MMIPRKMGGGVDEVAKKKDISQQEETSKRHSIGEGGGGISASSNFLTVSLDELLVHFRILNKLFWINIGSSTTIPISTTRRRWGSGRVAA